MRIFKINDRFSVVCQSLKTRIAFKHVATLMCDGTETSATVKICYQNRTWERYKYESVLEKLLDHCKKNDILSEFVLEDFTNMIKDQ